MHIDEVGFTIIGTSVLLISVIIDKLARSLADKRRKQNMRRDLWIKLGLDIDAHNPKKTTNILTALTIVVENLATTIMFSVELIVALMNRFVHPLPKNKQVSKSPPKRAQKLLSYMLKPTDIEVVLGDMDELFLKHAKRHGYKSARRWYVWQVIRSVAGQAVGKIMKLGIFTYINDIIHKIIS